MFAGLDYTGSTRICLRLLGLVILLATVAQDSRAQITPDSTSVPDSTNVPDSTTVGDSTVAVDSLASPVIDSVLAQPTDTSFAQPVDSLAPPPRDTLVTILHPFTHEPRHPGAVVDSVKPADGYHLDITSSLAFTDGSFTYGLGNVGSPDQWSHAGLPPTHVELVVDGMSVRDPVTHRSLYDVLPVDMMGRPIVSTLAHGSAAVLYLENRPLLDRRPYSELRYEVGARGLQSISALHMQQRQWNIFGAPTVTQFVARFAFHEWTGGYPNSESNLSQVFGRVGFTSRRWRIRFTNSYSLRTRGAHSGVEPKTGQGFDSVYDRFDSSVGDPLAEQRHQRNQFDVSAEHTWTTDMKPLMVAVSLTKSLYRYTNFGAPESKANEFRILIQQTAPNLIRGHEVTGRATFESIGITSIDLLNGGGGAGKSRFIVSVDDQFAVGRSAIRAAIGLQTVDEWTYPTGGLNLRMPVGGITITAEVSANGRAPSPLERVGGLGITAPDDGLTNARTLTGYVALEARGASMSIRIKGFANSIGDPTEIITIGDGFYQVKQATGSSSWMGVSAELGWRSERGSGLYAAISPTLQVSSTSTDDPILHGLANSLPELHGWARFGIRKLLFQGDLDADLYLIGRAWSSFQGRAYDPVHALMVLPEVDARAVDASGTVDIRLEAGIREATLYVSYDNALAGLLYSGALTVPVYPLADRAFRFGVQWPIWN